MPSVEPLPAVLAHGTGSRPAFLLACLQRPLAAAGVRVVPVLLPGHGGERRTTGLGLADHAAALAEAARREGARLVGGISLGAHAATSLAVAGGVEDLAGLLLALPAWTGAPGTLAAANAVVAAELERDGLAVVLARVRSGAPPWVAAEVAASWREHDLGSLIAALRAAAVSSTPTLAELASVAVPAAVAVVTGDPLHPAGVGRAWASALPRSACRGSSLAEMARDPAALGRALAAAWIAATAARIDPTRSPHA